MFFGLATARVFVPSSATVRPPIRPCSRQNLTKAALALTIASGLSWWKVAIVR
jgi:hypothetical protein